MGKARNPDGTIDVRIVLQVTINRDLYAETVMGAERPADVLDKDVRQHLKRQIRTEVLNLSEQLAIADVDAEGVYPTKEA